MGLLKGIMRVATAPVEITARTVKDVFDPDNNDEANTGLDICTLGATRVARGAIKGIHETFENIIVEFDD